MIARIFKEGRMVAGMLPSRDLARWCGAAMRASGSALRARSLGPVDKALGGSFSIHHRGKRVRFVECDLGVVREIFGHYCYGRPEDFHSARVIVDLGANCGAFTLFALLNAPHARVFSVEAQPELTQALTANLERNDLRGRAVIENALVGGVYDAWSQDLVHRHPTVGTWDFERTLPPGAEVDFLKCDIEGAEFKLLDPVPSWLRRVRHFSMEYHGDWAKGAELAERLRVSGFSVAQRAHRELGYLSGTRIDD